MTRRQKLACRTLTLLTIAFMLSACGSPQIPEPYLGSGVSFEPVVFLRTEAQFLGRSDSRVLSGGGGAAHALGGNGFYITTSGCFVTPLSLKRRLQGFSGALIKDLQVLPARGHARVDHIGDLDEPKLSVMLVTDAGITTAFPLPEQPYRPQPGEKFLILSHEGIIGEVESDGKSPSAVALTDTWGEQERVIAYWLKGRAEGGSLKRMSGAPVVNSRGEAIGLWVGRGPNREGIFALPISRSAVQEVLGQC